MNDTYTRAGNAADPPSLSPGYKSTVLRAPSRPLVIIPQTLSEITGPVYGHSDVKPGEADLTKQHAGEPLGERIIVQGRVLDEAGRAVPNTLVEIWQCNAAGRYIHETDQHPAPLDPNFTGAGRVVTDEHGHYQFTTVKPGAYPWRNHHNAWRPAHIHLSLFGPSFLTRLVTQMYFPGDPAVPVRSDLQFGHRREGARAHDLPVRHGDHQAGMGARLHLRHRPARPRRHAARHRLRSQSMTKRTPSQTVGPYLHLGLTQGVFGAPEIFGPAVADAGAPAPTSASRAACSTAKATCCPTR